MRSGLVLALLCGCAGVEPGSPRDDSTAAVLARVHTELALADLYKPVMDATVLDPYQAPLIYVEPPGSLAQPTVWVEERIEGDRRRLVFAWLVSTADGDVLQGLRATFGPDGQPDLFEVAHDESGLPIAFASQSVEADAVPSDVLVAATFADGPMAMGPYLYHSGGTSDVLGLHCRCEPPRAREIGDLIEYELRPLDELGERPVFAGSEAAK